MKNSIQPIPTYELNCMESLIPPVAKWWNRNFELMHTEAWGFTMDPQDSPEDDIVKIMSKLNTNHADPFKYLYAYHGIGATFCTIFDKRSVESIYGSDMTMINCDVPAEKLLQITYENLKAGNPVIIKIDEFYCPWHHCYNKKHYIDHYCLATGINEDGSLHCIDGVPIHYSATLPVENFLQATNSTISMFLAGDVPNTIDWCAYIKNIAMRAKSINFFENIRELARRLQQNLDVYKERYENKLYKNTEHYFVHMCQTHNNRDKLLQALLYVSKKYDVPELKPCMVQLELIKARWNRLRSILTKGSRKNTFIDAIQKAIHIVYNIAELEEKFADLLLETARLHASQHLRSVVLPSVVEINTTGIKATKQTDFPKEESIIFIDLKPYYNNQGFGSSLVEETAGDITGDGSYMEDFNLPQDKIWETDGMQFLFPEVSNTIKDNISCVGQTIDIPKGSYVSLMLLGCSEWGHYKDMIQIEYADGHVENEILAMTDWTSEKIAFDESRFVWTSKGVDKSSSTHAIKACTQRLYAQRLPMDPKKEAIKIHLPDCRNLHIFSASLGSL